MDINLEYFLKEKNNNRNKDLLSVIYNETFGSNIDVIHLFYKEKIKIEYNYIVSNFNINKI